MLWNGYESKRSFFSRYGKNSPFCSFTVFRLRRSAYFMPGVFFTPEPNERSKGSFVEKTLLSGTLRSLTSAERSRADGLPPITRRTGCWRLRLRSIFSMLARKSASYPRRSSSMNTSALRVTCKRTASRTSCFLKSCGM